MISNKYRQLLLDRVISIVEDALVYFKKIESKKKYYYDKNVAKEMKAEIDILLNDFIVDRISNYGIDILSEESGDNKYQDGNSLKFIIDPLDGTVNFIRGIGDSAISIALIDADRFIFGVVGIISTSELFWGGDGIGANDKHGSIKVSNILEQKKSILCTGFPSRLDLNNNDKFNQYFDFISSFGKVRMLGSASISLVRVAQGSAECYFEKDIMIWDVAAGLAILQGAGGNISINPGSFLNSYDVFATNGNNIDT